jgi:hypothetical protein
VIVDTTAVVPAFTALKEAMLPLPLAARPIEGSLFVQLNTTPAGVPLKLTGAVLAPLHTV